MKTQSTSIGARAKSSLLGWLYWFGRRLTRRLWLPEIEAYEADAMIKELHATEGAMELHIQQSPWKAQWMAQCFANIVSPAPNYVEMKFDTVAKQKNGWEWITVTVQKGKGKTPHQMRQQAERERDEYKTMLNAEPTDQVTHRGEQPR